MLRGGRMSPMRLIDTHAHLCDPVFDGDRAEVLSRAREAGVERVVAVGETLDDARRNLELWQRHPELAVAVGVYPTVLDPAQADAIERLARERRGELVAIGEVGLDHRKVEDAGARELQREIFGRMIALSLELNLPLNVHSRSAGRHAVAFLLERGARRVQLHAFDGRAAAALPAVEAGFFFSVPPSVQRSRQKQKLVRRLPLECLLLETDSPVLGADPAERNEPAHLVRALRTVAELKGVPERRVAETVLDNTRRLYGEL